MPVLTDGDYGVMKVLIILKDRFICPKDYFGLSVIGLLEAIWSVLCMIGHRVRVGGV